MLAEGVKYIRHHLITYGTTIELRPQASVSHLGRLTDFGILLVSTEYSSILNHTSKFEKFPDEEL